MSDSRQAVLHSKDARQASDHHTCELYADEEALCSSVTEYLGGGLLAGQPLIVIATGERRDSFCRALRARCFDIERACQEGQLTLLDAHETLGRLLVDGMPDWSRFEAQVGAVVKRVSASAGGKRVRAYGEMVDILWSERKALAAIRLEEFWNQLAKGHSFSLLCAYRAETLKTRGDELSVRRVYAAHTHVSHLIPTEKHFRLLVESAFDYAIFMLDPQGYIASWNPGAERLKGYSSEEIIGEHFSRFYPEDEGRAERCARELEHAVRFGRFEEEGWRIRKDGSRFWANVIITAVYDDHGRHVGFSKVTRDLTERKLAAERLLREQVERGRAEAADEQRRFLHAVFEGLDDGITVQDRTGKVIFANSAAAQLTGLKSAKELLDTTSRELSQGFEMFDAEGNPFPADRLPGRAVLAGRPGDEVLVRFRARGSTDDRWSLVGANPILAADGTVAQAVNVFRDVTQKHREETQQRFLMSAVEQFNSSLDYEETLATVARQIVPALADWSAVDLLEEDGSLKRLAVGHADPEQVAFVEELERRYPSDPNAPGAPRSVLVTGEPFFMDVVPASVLKASARNEEHLRLIERLKLRSFMAVPMRLGKHAVGVLTLATSESGRTYTARDVLFASTLADRAASAIENARLFRQIEHTLARERSAREEAERATRLADTFVGILGHDLRNPLNAISMGASLVLRCASDERVRRPAMRILSSTERMTKMIEQLLDFTRIRLAGGITIEPIRTNLAEVAQQIVDETQAAHSCTIELERAGDTCGAWDGDRVGQLLSNLLANAVQHGEGGHPVRVRLDGRGPAEVILEVRNRGRIPPEIRANIFEPFRGEKYQRGAGRGLGLGLFITREIVQAHGGVIEVSSTEEGDTVFRIRLPRGPRQALGPR